MQSFNKFDKWILTLGNLIIQKPRASGSFLLALLVFTLTGWLIAIHYHRLTTVVPLVPDELIVAQQDQSSQIPAPEKVSSPLQPSASQNLPLPQLTGNWQTIIVKRGDNLQRIFKRLHLSQAQLAQIMALGESTRSLKSLKPHQQLRFLIDNKKLMQLIYPIDAQHNLIISRTTNGFTTNAAAKPTAAAIENQIQQTATIVANTSNNLQYGSAIVQTSLYQAGAQAGLTHKQVMQLVTLFSQNPEFSKNIHSGDKLSVLYEPSNTINDEVYSGNIVLAQLISHHKKYQIIRFTDNNGNTNYYTSNGLSLRPPILRAPLNYTYISSRFSAHRWEPILHFFRPHYGIDYAAPQGTPIKAAGDGKIIYAGLENGYGKTITIKHMRPYETLYAHLSRFAKGIKTGDYVHQGQVIGYVGSTGLSTGAHLHFEIRVNNTPHNPLTVALPAGTPLPQADHVQFAALNEKLLAQLATHPESQLAAETAVNSET